MSSCKTPHPSPGQADDDLLEPFRGRRSYLSLTTYRRDGSAVTTPVWCVVDDDRVLMRTDSESYKVQAAPAQPIRLDRSVRFARQAAE